MSRIRTLVPRQDGGVTAVNMAKLGEIPFFLGTNPPNQALVLAANQASAPIVASVSNLGPIDIYGFSIARTGGARVSISVQDGENQKRYLMNRAIHVDTIFGGVNGVFGQVIPYRLPVSLLVRENRPVTFQFSDISGNQNTIRACLHAARYSQITQDRSFDRIRARLSQRQYLAVPFFYTLNNGLVNMTGAPGTVNDQYIDILPDAHFEIHTITAFSGGAFDINIVDVTNGESIIEAFHGDPYPVNSGLCVGTPNFPFRLHEPRMIAANSKLLVRFVDQSAQPNTIYLTLGGRALSVRMWS